MKRILSCLCFGLLLIGCSVEPDPVEYRELDIASLQELMSDGELTAVALTEYYLRKNRRH